MTELAAQIGSGAAIVGAGVLGLCTYSLFAPTSQLYFPVVCRGDDSSARVALTFDDGPGPATAPILDALRKLRVQAAFFVIGTNAERYPELVRRIDGEGHIVANHTYDHKHWASLKLPGYWRDQLMRTDKIIVEILGKRPAFFRPPLGRKSWWMSAPLRQSGHVTVCWSRRAYDGVPTTTEKILARMVGPARAGDILVLHDGQDPRKSRNPAPTIAAIEPMIRGLRERGFEFERLDRLIGLAAYSPAPSEREGSTGLEAEAARA
jgi:peptidoglycan/xylan/chitin deacetylase (PgdA/CDA1 family)